jgi:hypothetical protein
MDDKLIAALTAVIEDLKNQSVGWDMDSLRVAVRVLITRRMELENWDTFQEVPD